MQLSTFFFLFYTVRREEKWQSIIHPGQRLLGKSSKY